MAGKFNFGPQMGRNNKQQNPPQRHAKMETATADADGQPYGEEPGDGTQIASEHGPDTQVTITHKHEQGWHHVHSIHPDGHENHSDHASAEEAHEHARKLSTADGQEESWEGEDSE